MSSSFSFSCFSSYLSSFSSFFILPSFSVLVVCSQQFDDTGVACIMVAEPKKNFYKKFLHEPFPVESSIHKQLHDHINAEIASGTLGAHS